MQNVYYFVARHSSTHSHLISVLDTEVGRAFNSVAVRGTKLRGKGEAENAHDNEQRGVAEQIQCRCQLATVNKAKKARTLPYSSALKTTVDSLPQGSSTIGRRDSQEIPGG